MSESERRLTAEQRAAVEARDRDVLLEAGAGTGKTTVLASFFCDAVTVDGAGLGDVLAFTFTDRAAAELRQRIRGELRSRGDVALARETEAAWISTIHGFCQRLCASHAVALGLDPRYRVLGEAEADRLAARAFDGALERFLVKDLPEREQLVAAYRLPRLRRLIRSAHEELRSRGEERPELPPATSGEAAHLAAYEGLRELLRLYAGRYAELKDERSGLDFEDLQLYALRLLRETRAGERWRGRFRHILVDEFQDTNRLQLALIEALRGPETSVFAVGDENQSIYGFRHADVGVFRGQRQSMDVLPLRGNFRSRTGVLGGVNWVGRALLGDEEAGFPELTAGDPGAVDAASGEATELLLPSVRDDEPAMLGARLARLHADGVPLGEIVVLLRSMTRVADFEEALERAGLRPYVVGGRGYWSQQQVDDMRCLLGAIDNPADEPAMLGALASPACGVLPDTLWLMRHDEAAIPPEERAKLDEFEAKLARLRDEASVLPLEDLVDRAAREFDYDLAAASLPGGSRRLANVRKLMRLAREFEEAEGRDLRGFLDFLDSRASTRDGAAEGQAATQAEEHEGVRIMTVHAAKGLEFPVVAVADLGRRLSGRPAEILIGRREEDEGRVGIQLARIAAKGERLFDYEDLKDAVAEDEIAEECRLAYVAASRAERRLILSGCLDDGWDRKPPEERAAGRPIVQRLMEARGDAPRGLAFVTEVEPIDRAPQEDEPKSAPVRPLESAPPLAVPPPREPDADDLGEGTAFGNAVHALLDACAREDWRPPSRQRIVAALAAEGIADEGEADRAEAMITGFLASPIATELRGAERVSCELPFVASLDGVTRAGRIDVLAELPNGERLVVDYKTNRLEGTTPERLMTELGYDEQRRLYALAAGAGGPVRTAFVFLNRPEEPVVEEMTPSG
jgi:ATP-dependent helicase/nuclease subunit A